MKNAPMDEPNRESDQPTSEDEDQPNIVAGVGSSALGSVDLEEEEDVEPQRERHPDNDGETVEG